MSDQTTIIDLIRHGEPVGGSKYRGQVDDPLSDKGWRQMREAVGDHHPWQAIVSSPLSRCAEFARELAQRHALPLSFDDRFKEIGFGDWEGCTKEQITARDPQALFRFYSDPVTNTPPGAESLLQFRERIGAAWLSLIEQYAGRHVLLVGHAGVIRMVLRQVLDVPLERIFRIDVPNAAISRIRIDGYGQHALTSLMFHAGRL